MAGFGWAGRRFRKAARMARAFPTSNCTLIQMLRDSDNLPEGLSVLYSEISGFALPIFQKAAETAPNSLPERDQ